mgnify:CR=1 FL=1
MQNVSIENGNFLNVKIDGDKNLPKVILSNSLGADIRMWDLQVEALKNKFCVIRYDKRGHGKSSPVEGPYSFEMLEGDVITILDELEIEKAHFVGLSIGGMTSLGLALKQQNRFLNITIKRSLDLTLIISSHHKILILFFKIL